ncbi:MAG: deoxyribodipyrimidine photolyase [Planctomycetota bacterium]
MVPKTRIRTLVDRAPNLDADFVLYWMIANRRLNWNFSLDRAVEWCRELRKPLLVLEPLRLGYRWASDRLHQFVLAGMGWNQAEAKRAGIAYHPYVERTKNEGKGLLETLSARAAVVVTDDFPCFFLPRMQQAACAQVSVRFEAVDSNGLLPMRSTDKVYPSAYAFRRFLQKELPEHLASFPMECPLQTSKAPLAMKLPAELLNRWPRAEATLLNGTAASLAALPIDHAVGPAPFKGGTGAAREHLSTFLDLGLPRYRDDRNQPEARVTSGLSPYLHFGHISVHEIFSRLRETEAWHPRHLSDKSNGHREGWWGMSPASESFLDELVTWRELGFNFCSKRDDYDRYESLPDWARQTLDEHQVDRRKYVYSLEDFEDGQTHDELWNAAQNELRNEGRIHNYLRMLWGKKILEWTASPRDALEVMIELNNKYAVDGRDPNSYSGIFWVLGRYDRPWGPERPIFGKIRYMSSENTARKVRVDAYVARHGHGNASLFDLE